MRTNFSADEMKIFDLANDLARGDFSIHVDKEKVTRSDLENYLREKINKDIESIEGNINSIGTDISGLNDRLSTAEGKITTAEENITNLSDKTGIDGITEENVTLYSMITDEKTRAEGKENELAGIIEDAKTEASTNLIDALTWGSFV